MRTIEEQGLVDNAAARGTELETGLLALMAGTTASAMSGAAA